MSDVLEWAEQAGLENLRSHLQAADSLIKESNTTLAILLTGAGAALAYAIKGMEAVSLGATVYVALALSLYLFLLCGALVFKCIRIGDIPPPTNEPMNLYQPDYELAALRKVELKNIQARIRQAATRNNSTANWLNRIRTAAILGTPLITAASFLSVLNHLSGLAPAVG